MVMSLSSIADRYSLSRETVRALLDTDHVIRSSMHSKVTRSSDLSRDDARTAAGEIVNSPPSILETASPQTLKTGKRRGRRPNQQRRDANRKATRRHGESWRDHLGEIFRELDSNEVFLGDFQDMRIDLGDGQSARTSKWDNLDLAEGDKRRQIIDILRKYAD
jgi:hypothetical protein